MSLAFPAPCPAFFGDVAPPVSALQAQTVITEWLLAPQWTPADRQAQDPQLLGWLSSPATAQAAWVSTTFAQLRACQLAAIRMPF